MCYYSVPEGRCSISLTGKRLAPAAFPLGRTLWESFSGELLGRASEGKPVGAAPGESSSGKLLVSGPWFLAPDPWSLAADF